MYAKFQITLLVFYMIYIYIYFYIYLIFQQFQLSFKYESTVLLRKTLLLILNFIDNIFNL